MDTSKRPPDTGKNGAEANLLLLANGSSGPWDVTIDESVEEPSVWYAHVNGPSIDLYFSIHSLEVIAEALAFLESRPLTSKAPWQGRSGQGGGSLAIGAFGHASIQLVQDDEYNDRCFLIVETSGKPNLRLSFVGEEINHLRTALQQVKEDLGEEEVKTVGSGP